MLSTVFITFGCSHHLEGHGGCGCTFISCTSGEIPPKLVVVDETSFHPACNTVNADKCFAEGDLFFWGFFVQRGLGFFSALFAVRGRHKKKRKEN